MQVKRQMYALHSCWSDKIWMGNGPAKAIPATENVLSSRYLKLGKLERFGVLYGDKFVHTRTTAIYAYTYDGFNLLSDGRYSKALANSGNSVGNARMKAAIIKMANNESCELSILERRMGYRASLERLVSFSRPWQRISESLSK